MNSFAGIKDNRLKEIMSSIITHLHEVVKEVEPTEEEWMKAIMFLTKTLSLLRTLLLSSILLPVSYTHLTLPTKA